MGNTPIEGKRCGFLGLGLMGTRMAKALVQHGVFPAQAAYDADPNVTASWAKEFRCHPHHSAEALIADPNVDWVYIATPPASHADLAIQAMRVGKPVLLEKPLAASVADAERMVAAAKEHGAVASMHFPFATLPGLARMRRELARGHVGPVRHVAIELHFSQWPRTWHKAGPWLAGSKEGGFCREVFSHFAYLTQTLLGPIEVRHKDVRRADHGTEVLVHATMRAGETPVSLVADVAGGAPDSNLWTLHGEHQSFRVRDWSEVTFGSKDRFEEHVLEANEGPGIATTLDQWQAALTGSEHGLASLEDGLGVLRTVESLLLD